MLLFSHRQQPRSLAIISPNGRKTIKAQELRGVQDESALAWMAAIAIPLILIAPAIWNGYPLLQYDTGGYLARWYEGYLVPSRSTVFGLYLHFGQGSYFWINLGDSGAGDTLDPATDAARVWLANAVSDRGCQPRLDPDHGAALARQHAADRHLRRIIGAVALHSHCAWRQDFRHRRNGCCSLSRPSPRPPIAQRLACCSGCAAPAGSRGPCCASGSPFPGLVQGSLTIVAGAAMLLAANFALSGQLAWTPGGYGVAFGRMMQDGIVKRYLDDHCPTIKLKLCPYRNELPATADEFLWGNSMFNTLGRFDGLNDEMGFIAVAFAGRISALAGRSCRSSRPRSNLSMWPRAKALTASFRTPTASSSVTCRRQLAVDACGASAALGHQFRRDQLAPRSGGADLDACCFSACSGARFGAGGLTMSRCSRLRCLSLCLATPLFAA